MSQNPSWRPTPSRRRSTSTRKWKIFGLSVVVAGIVGLVAFLMAGPRAVRVHFAVICADLAAREAPLTPRFASRSGTAGLMLNLAKMLREKNSELMGDVSEKPHRSLRDFINSDQDYGDNASAVIYLSCDAICRLKQPGQVDGDAEVVLLMPEGRDQIKEEKLSDLLDHLRKLTLQRSLLLLDITGPPSGFASGALADDWRSVLKTQLIKAAVPNLSVICSHEAGQRSWEFKTNEVASSAAESETSEPTNDTQPDKGPSTAFGHFVVEAIYNGKAHSNGDLLAYLKKHLITQDVWMAGRESDLLMGSLRVPSTVPAAIAESVKNAVTRDQQKGKTESAKGGEEAEKENKQVAGTGSERQAESQSSDRRNDVISVDDSVLATLSPMEVLEYDRDQADLSRFQWLGDAGVPVLRDRISKQKSEFEDRMRKSDLSSLNIEENELFHRWIAQNETVESASDEKEKTSEPSLADALKELQGTKDAPPKLSLPRTAKGRSVFAADVVKYIRTAAAQQTAEQGTDSAPDPIHQIQRLLQALPQNGWQLSYFPESMATVYEVVHGPPLREISIKHLSTLLTVRQQVYSQYLGLHANPTLSQGKLWSQIAWMSDQELKSDLKYVLSELSAAQRWLTVEHGQSFASRRLDNAVERLGVLRSRQTKLEKQAELDFRIQRELPFLAQFLASEMDRHQYTWGPEVRSLRDFAESVNQEDAVSIPSPGDTPEPLLSALDKLMSASKDENRAQLSESVREVVETSLQKTFDELQASQSGSLTGTRLIAIPRLSKKEELAKLLYSPGSRSNQVDARSRTSDGIWMGYWSLRTLDWLNKESGGGPCNEGWEAWKELVKSTTKAIETAGTDSQATPETSKNKEPRTDINARIRLAEILRKAWSEVKSVNVWDQDKSRTLHGTVISLLKEEANRRSEYSVDSQLHSLVTSEAHQGVRRDRISSVELGVDQLLMPSILPLGENRKIYVHSTTKLRLEGRPAIRDGWYELRPEDLLGGKLKIEGELTEKQSVCLVEVDSTDQPILVERIEVSPRMEFEWKLFAEELLPPDNRSRSVTLMNGDGPKNSKDLYLPPYIVDRSIRLGLSQDRGSATEARVSVYPLKNRAKDEARPILKDAVLAFEGKNVSWIVKPPSPDSATAPPEVPSNIEGLVIEVVPVVRTATEDRNFSQELWLNFKFHNPEEYATVESQKEDNGQVSLEVNVNEREGDYAGIRQDDQEVNAQAYTIWDAKVTGLFPSPKSNLLEVRNNSRVSVDVVGVKDVFQWTSTETNLKPLMTPGVTMSVVYPDGKEGSPKLRAWRIIDDGQLQDAAVNTDGRKLLERAAELVFHGDDAENLSLKWDVAIPREVLEGDGASPMAVELRIRKPKGENEYEDVYIEPKSLTGRYLKQVQVKPAEKAFLVSSQWSHHSFGPVPLVESLKQLDEEGRYECEVSVVGVDEDPQTTAFWIDRKPPEVKLALKDPEVDQKRATGAVEIKDSGSGIKSLTWGFSETAEDQKEISLREYPSRPNPRWRRTQAIPLRIEAPPNLDFAGKPEASLKVHVVATDFLGRSTKQTANVRFWRRMPKDPPKPEAMKPGSIVVADFRRDVPFTVTVSGTALKEPVVKERESGAKEVSFGGLEPGSYKVSWQVKSGSAAFSGEKSVEVRSEKETKVSAN